MPSHIVMLQMLREMVNFHKVNPNIKWPNALVDLFAGWLAPIDFLEVDHFSWYFKSKQLSPGRCFPPTRHSLLTVAVHRLHCSSLPQRRFLSTSLRSSITSLSPRSSSPTMNLTSSTICGQSDQDLFICQRHSLNKGLFGSIKLLGASIRRYVSR